MITEIEGVTTHPRMIPVRIPVRPEDAARTEELNRLIASGIDRRSGTPKKRKPKPQGAHYVGARSQRLSPWESRATRAALENPRCLVPRLLDERLHSVEEGRYEGYLVAMAIAHSGDKRTMEEEVKRSYEIINGQAEEISVLREALAPFANRAAEKGMGCRAALPGGKYSVLTDSQWCRALEAYQECPGGDMCGCKPSGKGEKP